MHKKVPASLALVALLLLLPSGGLPPASAGTLKVVSDQKVTGFAFPESVGCDADNQLFYVSEFGSELNPTQRDGKGRITKMSLDGRIIARGFLPVAGQVLNKPKGIWIRSGRLWVTDIDSVWEFDLKSKKGRKVALPGIEFANDPTIIGGDLYVSDNLGDRLYRVEPAEFLEMSGEPKVTVVFAGKSVNPNGLYPAHDGSLLMVGFLSKSQPRAIFKMAMGGEPVALSDNIGLLDGVYEMKDGDLLVTDWNSGSLFRWDKKSGMETLASGFKGPADLCVVERSGGLTVAVPDLPGSVVRIIELAP